ncbi:alpha,alpha-trehalose-phosphate synthase (UDP-forming) [Massilia oculi]|uniref:alpha,alpha-trehalose-phosphate synthase (UDP-forming) n=1 Tax=Massilia oculi TaxID=945844 RepID=UPI001AAEF6C1|nr:trehalose-6-phosphate synthase [Massilia oculi]
MRFRSVQLSMRFIVPLALVLALFGYFAIPWMENLTVRWFVRDLDTRSQLVSSTLQQPLLNYLEDNDSARINDAFSRAIQDERLYALAFCDPGGTLRYKTDTYPESLGCRQGADGEDANPVVRLPRGPVHVSSRELTQDGISAGRLILVQDMSFIERRSEDTKKYIVGLFVVLAGAISLITVLIAHLSWHGWLNGVREMLRGELSPRASKDMPPEIAPLASELRALLNEYNRELQGSGVESQTWGADTLKTLLNQDLAGDEILVVSNREPYIHVNTPNGVKVQRPASGLVTAVEAVMRACSGTWIAHGAGSADRDTVDANDHVRVPPENPSYTLRRVWLSKEEEQGYYYGFANEGLWPLCHIAHVRPVFRSSDWAEYVRVNQRFADAVIAEARSDNPVVLVQDYHFALLPRMVRAVLPKATIITFWHIPWPNPESFGICPWREEILDGMLGSTILGFHTPFHRKNFLDTVDRYLETRIENEASTVSYGNELTQVKPYPISIAWPQPAPDECDVAACRAEIRQALSVPPDQLLGIGVDRLDYTKGIVERFQAVERMLELHPDMVGKFTFVQIAAPTRSSLDEYQNFEARVRALAQRINQRFSSGSYLPIILKTEHHEQAQLRTYFRASEVCSVTSLHDGMNLVAKEFIASRDDEQGVLILSQFTGAARELHEALIVNPYHIEEGAEALYRALRMPQDEQRERMRTMRVRVRDFNVYRWAGRMLQDAARLRQRERVRSRINSLSQNRVRKGDA